MNTNEQNNEGGNAEINETTVNPTEKQFEDAMTEVREIAEQDEAAGFSSITDKLEKEKSVEIEPSDASDTTGIFFEDESDNDDFFAKASGDADELFDESEELPAFDFAVAPVIELKDGTVFEFKIPDLDSERRADNLRKTLILTSPARVNGFNPTQETTDYATADMRYFLDNCLRFKGLVLKAGDNPNEFIDAKSNIGTVKVNGKARTITPAHRVPVKHARAAVARLYGGKIEVEKADTDDKRVVVLNETRYITVKQEFGVEQNDDGTFTRPTNIVKYIFREPTAKELTFWQTKCFLGYKIPIKGGGSREERFFNTEKTVELFDSLIERIEGGAMNGESLSVKNSDHLKDIPVGVKRTAITLCMGEVSGDVGNS